LRRVRCLRGQALVEMALVAPIVILLAVAAWDGGSILREQVILQQAARDGARAAATDYAPGAAQAVVANAVQASAADLPALISTPGYLTISYPNAQSVEVRLRYAHVLITPVLRQLWAAGQGAVVLSASAVFYLPPQTPVPATIVPSTPAPTPTLTASPTATPTPQPTATPSPTPSPTPGITTCTLQVTVPPLQNNSDYLVSVQLTVPSYIAVTWDAGSTRQNIALAISSGPYLVTASDNATTLALRTPETNLTGPFTVTFHKQGVALPFSTQGTIEYQARTCP
jgi:Flp pilus assembly protein TadG